jgi:ribosomal protein L11 methyltransferase
VTQPWNPVAGADTVVITVDPGSAFGTGEHPTTRGALRLLETAIRGGDTVLDVGAGSGILSIAAVLLGAERALAVESDPGAIDSARENLERNGVAERVELVCAEVDVDFMASRTPAFDVIAANVLSGVLVPLLPGLARGLAPDGRLILAGILDTEAADLEAAAGEAGLGLRAKDWEGEWWAGLFGAGQAPTQ